VEIHISQGERAMAADNKSLGRFILDGIPPAPRGMPQVEVTFDVDANGILSVKAKDKATNKEQSIRIEANSGLSKEDIEKMKKDAEAHDAEDKKKKDEIEVKNTADHIIYSAEKAVKDNKDKVGADIVAGVEAKIATLKTAKDATPADIEAIKKATEELSTEMSKIGEAMSKAGAAGAEGSSANTEAGSEASAADGTNGDEKVRDAETK
jgi:molecular chaperone DnaK